MNDKEEIYDKEIFPLMEKIISICKKHDMPFFASFQFSDDGFCTTAGRLNGHVVFDYYDALRHCIEKEGINIDKFMLWIMKGARKEGHSSIVLNQLKIPWEPEKKVKP